MATTERPILITEVIDADGERHLRLHVYCPALAEVVSIDTCRTCSRCVTINGDLYDATSWVECNAEAVEVATKDSSTESPIGLMLKGRTVCVRSDTPVSDLPEVFLRSDLPVLFVVDSADELLGAVEEIHLLRASGAEIFHRAGLHESVEDLSRPTSTAADIMSTAHPAHDDDSLHRTLVEMAHTRSRRIAVVTKAGKLVGTLRDLDAIDALAARNRKR